MSAQVETIRDAYMVVAGVPNKTTFHAHHICDMALDMLSSIDHLKDPSTGDNIQIRVGKIGDWTPEESGAGIGRSFLECYQLPIGQVGHWLCHSMTQSPIFI